MVKLKRTQYSGRTYHQYQNGNIMTREEIEKFENGFFLPAYDLFQRHLVEINSHFQDKIGVISLFFKDDFTFNAHAKKKGSDYIIVLLSGLVPMTFDVLSENEDFFLQKYPHLKERETALGLGCNFIWNHIFGHELGHILRGHLSFIDAKATNLVGDYQVSSMGYNAGGEDFNDDHLKMLMEHDADVFSVKFVGDILVNIIGKAQEINLKEEDVIGLCFSSIYFFFNHMCKLDDKNSKYPPAMVRANTLQANLIKQLKNKTSLSEEELEDLMNSSSFNAYSYLVDNGRLFQPMDYSSLGELSTMENDLLRKYAAFDKVLNEKNEI